MLGRVSKADMYASLDNAGHRLTCYLHDLGPCRRHGHLSLVERTGCSDFPTVGSLPDDEAELAVYHCWQAVDLNFWNADNA